MRFGRVFYARFEILAKIKSRGLRGNWFWTELSRFGGKNMLFAFALKNAPLVNCLRKTNLKQPLLCAKTRKNHRATSLDHLLYTRHPTKMPKTQNITKTSSNIETQTKTSFRPGINEHLMNSSLKYCVHWLRCQHKCASRRGTHEVFFRIAFG